VVRAELERPVVVGPVVERAELVGGELEMIHRS
jgi:hypothetical protein